MTRMSLPRTLSYLFIIGILKYTVGYENIALKKPTWQASTYGKFTSDRAVDGLAKNLSSVGYQCSISNNLETEAEWRVNLENILSIRYILIFYRTENIRWDSSNPFTGRFLGFSLYISNTTNKNEGHLCFHDTNYTVETIPSIVNISCPVHGKYVIYYNDRLDERTYPSNYSQYAYSELCEVKVYGCPEPGYYGDACSKRCPYLNCGYCHIETGQCLECKPGYQGNQCALVCGRGFYGKRCSESCGNCSYGETCHPIHGFCTNGCDVGVFGEKCNKICPMGFHGSNCYLSCGNCDTCDRFTGKCLSQCYAGWMGSLCTQECNSLTYGLECTKRCGKCLNGRQCHHINGSCLDGCDAGFVGILCKRRCDVTTERCESGCQSGWKGEHCKEGRGQHNDKKCKEKDIYFPSVKEEDNQKRFYGMLAALCLSMIVILALTMVQIYHCWKTKITETQNNKKDVISSQIEVIHMDENTVGVHYQELGELEQPSTYDTLSIH